MRIKDITTQARTPATDDFEDIDGATNGSRKITPAEKVAQFRNALSPRGGVAFDGTTNNRALVTLTGQNIAADNFSKSLVCSVPTANPTNTLPLMGIGPSSTDFTSSGGTVANVAIQTDGALRVDVGNGSGNFKIWTVSSFISNYGGKIVHIVVVRNGATPVIYINGVSQTVVSGGSGGTPPDYTLNITSTYLVVGYNATGSGSVLVGQVYAASFYNCALSAADVLEIYELGGGVPYRYQSGSQSEMLTGADSDFSNSVTNWSVSAGSPTFNTNTTVANKAYFLTQNAGGYQQISITKTIILGKAYRFSGKARLNAGSAVSFFAGVFGQSQYTLPTITGTETAFDSGPVVLNKLGNSANSGAFQFNTISGNGSAYEFDDFLLKQVGAVVHLPFDDGLGLQLQDISSNRLHGILSTSGASHLAPLFGPARFRARSNTNGNQQLGGAQSVLPATCQILRVRARSLTGTPTVKLGTSSGGAEVVASVALSTTWKDLTIALTGGIVTAAAALWANSGTTDTVEWDVTWEPLSA